MTGPVLLEDVPSPGPWRAEGACRSVPTPVFFPGRGASTAPAKAVCQGCAVVDECRGYALALPRLRGVWGGLSEAERKRARSDRAAAPGPARDDSRRPQRERRTPLYRTLEALTASPRRWARVAWYPGIGTAAGMAARLRAGRVRVPEGPWQFEAWDADGGSGLWARYVGGGERTADTTKMAG